MATTSTPAPVTPVAATPAKHSFGQEFDLILHDVLYAGTLAAVLFVKNPASMQKAGVIAGALQQLLNYLDPQLTGQAPTQP